LLPANFIIGIKEFKDYFAKIITKEKLIELIIIRTKQYAKRQFTWQRGQMSDWNQFFDQDYQKGIIKKDAKLLDFNEIQMDQTIFSSAETDQVNESGDNLNVFNWDGPENSDEEVEEMAKLKNEFEI